MNFFKKKTQEEIDRKQFEKNLEKSRTIQNRILEIFNDEFSDCANLFADVIGKCYRQYNYGGRLFVSGSYYKNLTIHGDILVVSNQINMLKDKLILISHPYSDKNNPGIGRMVGKLISCDENNLITLTNTDETLDDLATISIQNAEGEIIDIISMTDVRWNKYIYGLIERPLDVLKSLSEWKEDTIKEMTDVGRNQESKDLRRKAIIERIKLSKEKLKELEGHQI